MNMEISDLREQPHLSASGVRDYLDCGLLYKFSRIDRRQPESISDSLVLGRAIHAVLADFYRELQAGRRLTRKHLEERFNHHWEAQAHGRYDITYKPGKSHQSYRTEGKELLAAFIEQAPQEDGNVLAIEQAFTFELEGLPVPIIGIFDLVLEDPAGVITIVDHKTASKSYSLTEATQNFQMTVYHLAARAHGYGEQDILLRLDCLIKTKVPKFEQYYATRSEWEELRTVKKILAVWEGITKGVFIPNDTSWKCKGCGFKNACKEWFAEGNDAQR
jgi:putative RecB family exonuclease